MKAKSCLMLAAFAGGLSTITPTTRAGDPPNPPTPPRLSGDAAPAKVMGHIYINAATGEVVRTPGTSRLSDLYWQNDDINGSCNFFLGLDRPTRDTVATGRVKFGSAAVHWGDTPQALTDGYDVAYATNVGSDTVGSGITGLNLLNVFIDDYDGDLDPGGAGASGIAGFVIENINGGDATLGTSAFAGWIYTVDLEGTGDEFTWGSTDLDGDSLHDFAYSYEFQQGQTEAKGICGPFLVRPASLGGAGTAMGCPDAYDWFNQLAGPSTFSDYVGAFNFGGGDCAVPRPYASLFMNLYGPAAPTDPCDRIDFNRDGLINILDREEFMRLYEAYDPRADLNQDGYVDFGDVITFESLYSTCEDVEPTYEPSDDDLIRVNFQIQQPVLASATRLAIDLEGDRRVSLVPGGVPGTNPFINFVGEAANEVSFDGTTTRLVMSGPMPVPLSTSAQNRVGFEYHGGGEAVKDVRWGSGPRADVPVPFITYDIRYDVTGQAVRIRVKNTTAHTVSLDGSGFATILAMPRPECFHCSVTPPLTLIPTLDGELMPGSAKDAVVGMAPGRNLVVKTTVRFSGASAAEPFEVAGGTNCNTTYFGRRSPLCDIDFNCDGLTDFTDYLEFLNRFDAGDRSLDFILDGIVDFTDYLEFLNQYDSCAD